MINILLRGNIVMTYDDSELMGVARPERGATLHTILKRNAPLGREVRGKPKLQSI